jgi:tripartite ATP-independent transporter DctP family solute receptor
MNSLEEAMAHSTLTRRHVNLGLAAIGAVTILPGRARAAEFTLRHNHNLPTESPLHKRATEMWAAIRAETGGRVDVQISRGDAGLDMLVQGDLAFMTLAGNGLASLVPAADVQATPYGFRNPAEVHRALDGDLGAYLRTELLAKQIYAIPGGCFENGMHQITSTSKPIRTPADLQGIKMRVPGTPFYQDFFKSMGAQIVTMNLTRTYDGMKSGLVDAQDDPWDVVELFKFYEVQKYASVTDHSWSGYNLLASQKVWQRMPADVQRIIETNTRKFVNLQRADNDRLNDELRHDLERKGMVFNDADKTSFRATLASFYPRWKQHIGQRAWDLLEASVGKLG